jgi:hypothetical protein
MSMLLLEYHVVLSMTIKGFILIPLCTARVAVYISHGYLMEYIRYSNTIERSRLMRDKRKITTALTVVISMFVLLLAIHGNVVIQIAISSISVTIGR